MPTALRCEKTTTIRTDGFVHGLKNVRHGNYGERSAGTTTFVKKSEQFGR
ncbi:hypothetical protein RSSM_06452 [Rhodopirellula sallentina SM41]|uniref:Uncharacterized protein n=1 Tax=Rhodopirellula sallentina SM41 TaxID=1263870 RepID=M5U829_9BACT|nr:hypothetical protein RSSM_06452 [Rhodopirellula sallentina SM41]